MYSSAVLSWLRMVVLLFRLLVFMCFIVAQHPHLCLHVWTRGLVGWLVVPRAARHLFACGRVVGVGAPLPRVGVWVVSRERPCLREAGGWVGDVEGVAFVQELFCL